MRNGRSRHTRQSGDRRRRSTSSDRFHSVNGADPRSSHPGDLEPRYRPYDLDGEANDPQTGHHNLHQYYPSPSGSQQPPDRPPYDCAPPARPPHSRPSRNQESPPRGGSSHPHPVSKRSGRPSPSAKSPPRPQRPTRRGRRSQSSKKKSSRKQKQSSWQAIALQGFILSVALGLFCGLIARRWGAALSTLPDASGPTPPVSALAPSTFIAPSNPAIRPGAPIDELNQALESLDGEYPNLRLGAVLVDISQRNYAGLRAQEPFPAASTIKLAVLAAVMESVDRQDLSLSERLPVQQAAVAEGSGTLNAQPAGTEVSVLRAAELMISTSDNTATNLLIDRLGGLDAVNRRFEGWGLQHTELVNALPDFGGENTSSPADFALLLGEIERGQMLTMRSRDRFLDILSMTRNNSLLPESLSESDRIAHKTGTINSSLGDVGLIDLPNGERYIAAVMVRRENNDAEAIDVIREVSRLARNYWGGGVRPE